VAELGAAAAADDPRCASAAPRGHLSLGLHPRAVPAELGGVYLSSASVDVTTTANLAATREVVVPPGYTTHEYSFLNFGPCQMWTARPTGGGPLGAAIGVPRNVRVNGLPVEGAMITGVGETPTLTWDPPSLGTPTEYRVVVHGLRGASIVLPPEVRSFTVPPNLPTTTSHLVVITAYSGGIDGRRQDGYALPERSGATTFHMFP
jgi:hypothetical protein